MKRLSRLKYTFLVMLLLLAALQWWPRPARNSHPSPQPLSMESLGLLPDTVAPLLKTACYDCHSNNTHYPWYSKVQPIAWYLDRHIVKGKKELSFDEFAGYSGKKQVSKLESIAEQVKDGAMPLSSYTLLHAKAKLSKDQQQTVIHWAMAAAASLEQTQ